MLGNHLYYALLVGLGGFVGSSLRYSVAVVLQRALPAAGFPYATLLVNVAGCLLIGLLAGWRLTVEPGARLFLTAGVLGGFTTYSAFALETLTLAQQHSYTLALSNVALQLGLGLGSATAGFAIARVL